MLFVKQVLLLRLHNSVVASGAYGWPRFLSRELDELALYRKQRFYISILFAFILAWALLFAVMLVKPPIDRYVAQWNEIADWVRAKVSPSASPIVDVPAVAPELRITPDTAPDATENIDQAGPMPNLSGNQIMPKTPPSSTEISNQQLSNRPAAVPSKRAGDGDLVINLPVRKSKAEAQSDKLENASHPADKAVDANGKEAAESIKMRNRKITTAKKNKATTPVDVEAEITTPHTPSENSASQPTSSPQRTRAQEIRELF